MNKARQHSVMYRKLCLLDFLYTGVAKGRLPFTGVRNVAPPKGTTGFPSEEQGALAFCSMPYPLPKTQYLGIRVEVLAYHVTVFPWNTLLPGLLHQT